MTTTPLLLGEEAQRHNLIKVTGAKLEVTAAPMHPAALLYRGEAHLVLGEVG